MTPMVPIAGSGAYMDAGDEGYDDDDERCKGRGLLSDDED